MVFFLFFFPGLHVSQFSIPPCTGAGLVSKNKYYYGFFNAAMKLPAGFTSGIVIAFYVSFSLLHTLKENTNIFYAFLLSMLVYKHVSHVV